MTRGDDQASLERRKEIVNRFVSMRKERGLTQAQVAERMGVVQGSVQSFEAGSDPRISTIMRYARAIGAQVILDVSDA